MDGTAASSHPGDAVGQIWSPSSGYGASSTHSVTSPPSHPDLPSSALSDPPSPPLRRIVSSASELPSKEIRVAVFSQHVASDHYVEHHRKAIDALHYAHRHEKAAWDVERQELHAKIAELEAKIKRLQSVAIDSIALSSLEDKLQNYSIGGKGVSRSASTPGDYASAGTSRQPSVSGFMSKLNGIDEKGKRSMQSIPEEKETDRTKSVSFAAGALMDTDVNRQLEGVAIPGHLIDKDLDGISIKATSLPAATKKAILEDSKEGTPSPAYSPGPKEALPQSPGLKRPVTIEIPSTHQVLQLPVRDLYTHAAGNTPMARLADDYDDGDGSGTGGATPKGRPAIHMGERERPPLEPYPSTTDAKPVRPPHERGDSYFNVPVFAPVDQPRAENKEEPAPHVVDEDPALKGPLIMPTHPPPPRDKHAVKGDSSEFLDTLNEKLTSLSRHQSHGSEKSPPAADEEPNGTHDPPLRIRRSINFGTQFGHGPR